MLLNNTYKYFKHRLLISINVVIVLERSDESEVDNYVPSEASLSNSDCDSDGDEILQNSRSNGKKKINRQ